MYYYFLIKVHHSMKVPIALFHNNIQFLQSIKIFFIEKYFSLLFISKMKNIDLNFFSEPLSYDLESVEPLSKPEEMPTPFVSTH